MTAKYLFQNMPVSDQNELGKKGNTQELKLTTNQNLRRLFMQDIKQSSRKNQILPLSAFTPAGFKLRL